MSPAEPVFIYDTTLRDGAQREGISLSLNDKLKIARRLDAFGVHYIEGGWPGSNPKDAEFFRAVREIPLQQTKVAAFGATRYKDSSVEEDANLQALLEAETPVVTLVGKSWTLHVHDVLDASLELFGAVHGCGCVGLVESDDPPLDFVGLDGCEGPVCEVGE